MRNKIPEWFENWFDQIDDKYPDYSWLDIAWRVYQKGKRDGRHGKPLKLNPEFRKAVLGTKVGK